jgi:hypothetical protein
MKKCPLIGKKCMEHGCNFWTHLIGQNPQTGAQTDEWNCAISFLPMLLIENANQTRKVTASVDKVANETAGMKGAVQVLNLSFRKAENASLELKESVLTQPLRLMDAEASETPK